MIDAAHDEEQVACMEEFREEQLGNRGGEARVIFRANMSAWKIKGHCLWPADERDRVQKSDWNI